MESLCVSLEGYSETKTKISLLYLNDLMRIQEFFIQITLLRICCLNNRWKQAKHHEFRMSIKSKGDFIGLIEWFLGWPYRITSVKWISEEGIVRYIDKESVLSKIKNSNVNAIGLVCKFSWSWFSSWEIEINVWGV